MSLSEMFVTEFDNEVQKTRKTLDRVPEDKFSWKPHEKSMELGRLSAHLAEIPTFIPHILESDSFDINPPDGRTQQRPQIANRQQLLDFFDKNVAAGRAKLASASDEQFKQPWSLLKGGQTVFTSPRSAIIRDIVMNHMVHHRAQLGVYLRMNDVPVPAVYGPSADEAVF